MTEKAKYQFNGQTYSVKGRLCLAIVKHYVEQNPNVTLSALQKAFNTATRMIVATPEMALTIKNSDGKPGGDYYMKEEDRITIKKGEVVVWSYWPERYFEPFMEQVKALGLDVVVEEAEEKADARETRPTMKKLNLFIGGNDVYYFHVKDYGNGDKLDELRKIENDFYYEISSFFDTPNVDFVVRYNVVTIEDGLKVSVKDKAGKVIFEDSIDESDMNMADAIDCESWVFSESVDEERLNDIKAFIEEKRQEGPIDEDAAEEVGDLLSPRYDVQKVCEKNGYPGRKWFALKWGKLVPVDDEDERPEEETHFGYDYGVGYCGEIEIPEDEEFDINKLQFFMSDYDGFLPDDDYMESVLPFVKYGNKIFKLHVTSSYQNGENFGMVRLDSRWGSMSFKDYDTFLNE